MTKKTKREQDEATVEEWEERWTSAKNWFATPEGKKPKTLSTKLTYIRHLKRWCRITGLNPDQLAACEDIDKMRGIIVKGLDEDKNVHDRSIHHKIHPFNSFLEANGREVKDPYGGIPEPIRGRLLRLAKVDPEKTKERLSRLGQENKRKV